MSAVDDKGLVAEYSESGANLIVTSPSDTGWYENPVRQGIATTDLVGDFGVNKEGWDRDSAHEWIYPAGYDFLNSSYTKIMGGTSAAAPVVSGVAALMLEANPKLGWRDVQEILMRSAKKINPTQPEWIVNRAGLNFHHDFGAGMVDAGAAVTMARTWRNLPAQQTLSSSEPSLSILIPDNNPVGIPVRQYSFTRPFRVEHVTVSVGIEHAKRGQLEILLTSPAGTVSRLAELRPLDTSANLNWTFMTVRNWGENALGTWRLSVRDRVTGATGTLKSTQITIYGTRL